MPEATQADESESEEEYQVDFYVDAECTMRVDAASEEEAIEEAKEAIEQHQHYGTVSPVGGSEDNFQARPTNQ